jgi:membrane protein implicated in regulation of membrane protease activity
MTLTISSPVIFAALLVVVLELAVLAAFLWRRMLRIEDHRDDLADQADMQGNALREALNEIDRYRRLHRRKP